jgi:hypothetical protein
MVKVFPSFPINNYYIEDTIAPSGSHKIPINKFHEHGTSQKGVLLDHGSNWCDHLEPVIPDPTRILVLSKIHHSPGSLGPQKSLVSFSTFPRSLVPSISRCKMLSRPSMIQGHSPVPSPPLMTKGQGERPSPHIGFWAKGSSKWDGKPLGYPWVTKDTTLVKGATLQHLQIICGLLRDNLNNFIMNILRVEDPKLWQRMHLYVSLPEVK